MSTLVLVEAVTSLGPLRDGVIDDPCIREYGTTWNLSGRCFQQGFGMFCQQFQHDSSS